MKSVIGRLRLVGILEGLSFLLLLFVAMPLKYMWDKPEAVSVVGMAHGVLVLGYCAALLHAWIEREWKFGKVFLLFVAALVPFGPFVADRKLKAEELAEPGGA